MPISQAVPLLRVRDVARSIVWYRDMLGFVADPFPASAPHQFAILRHGKVEIMIRLSPDPVPRNDRPCDWDVYLRLEGTRFDQVFAHYLSLGIVKRRLEKMPYGLSEFEITDPDGYSLCLSQLIEETDATSTPA